MTNRVSVLWKILKGLAKKWPEMVVTWTIVTHRLGESVFRISGMIISLCETIDYKALRWFDMTELVSFLTCQTLE